MLRWFIQWQLAQRLVVVPWRLTRRRYDEEIEDGFVHSASSEADAMMHVAAAMAEASFETVDIDTPALIACRAVLNTAANGSTEE